MLDQSAHSKLQQVQAASPLPQPPTDLELENKDLKQKLAKALDVISTFSTQGPSQTEGKSSYESDFILKKYKEVKQQYEQAQKENEELKARMATTQGQSDGQAQYS